METTVNTQTSDIMPEPARPQFLTVLCILTWIMSGLMFILSIYGVVSKPSAEEQAEQVEKIRAINPAAAEQMEAAFESQNGSGQMINTLLGLVAIAISSMGAVMMWQLKKKGFYVYLAGELLPYLGFIIMGSESFGAMAAMSGMSASAIIGILIGVMALFDGIFIAMYAANMKHMKN